MQLTKLVHDTESLQEALAELAVAGKRIALVPTMGALHAGHVSLVELAKEHADEVIVYVFVNPKQFGPNEDYGKYPRTLDADVKMASAAGVAIVYAPSPADVYPAGFSTSVSVGPLSTILDGKSRPGHFDGVATVLAKMFMRMLPHVAVFGEKDYQQLCVIRRFVEDLDFPIEIVGAPTMREADGLAMSSRNVYLSKEERAIAPKLNEVLRSVGQAIASRSAPVKSLLDQGVVALSKAGFKVDYLELCDEDTLEPVEIFDASTRLLAAAWLGNTRLIDNIAVE
jgi:pantoate--beta-alanine ligase